MLVSVEKLKEYLGLPEGEDATLDPILERSSMMAQTLVESYIGFGIELDMGMLTTDVRKQLRAVRIVRFHQYPVKLSSLKIDGTVVPTDQYTMDDRLGVLEFMTQRTYIESLEMKYATGFDPDNMPKDLETAIANIAIGIYENGGKITTQVAGGALKSMTMFDAMSMSFDTGAASGVGTPEAVVTQWAFVLDKYRVDKFVMG